MKPQASLPDQSTRDAIKTQLDISMLVEAGAGTGKTHSLTDRMVAVVASGRCTLNQMAAITFTRKAAGELRGRFQVALEQGFRKENDPERKDRMKQALSTLEQLFTGTIHAFCARILRERPVEARVDPAFLELDEAESRIHLEQSWTRHLGMLYAQGDPRLLKLLEWGIKTQDLSSGLKQVCQYPEVEFPLSPTLAPDPAPLWIAFDSMWKNMASFISQPISSATTCPLQEKCHVLPRQLGVTRRNHLGDTARFFEQCTPIDKPIYKWWEPTSKDVVNQLLQDYNTFCTQQAATFLETWRTHLYPLIMDLLLEARHVIETDRIKGGHLDYQDLLVKTAEVLRNSQEVRTFFHHRFQCLFVDEFQDTDPIQAEIMMLITSQSKEHTAWTNHRPRPGSLFVVGDPKQSIYRFRRADIETYHEVKQIIEHSGGKTLTLNANFRSAPELLEWTNHVFETVFPAQSTPHQAAFVPLLATHHSTALPSHRVQILTLPDLPLNRTRALIQADADQIARWIRHAVHTHTSLSLGTRAKPGPRPMEYGDVLIILRETKHLLTYAHALETQGIPTEVIGESETPDSWQWYEIKLLLQSMAYPDEGLAIVGLLRGRLFGISDEALYAYHKKGGAFTLVASPDNDLEPTVTEALEQLHLLHRFTFTLPPDAAIEKMFTTLGLTASVLGEENGSLAAGQLRALLERARAASRLGASFQELALELIEELNSAKSQMIPLEPGRGDVVRLMNLHKVKGLEAPVVILGNPYRNKTTDDFGADARILRHGGRPVGYLAVSHKEEDRPKRVIAAPKDWDRLEAEELVFLRAEEARLQYVAATRARDLLIITRLAPRPKPSSVVEKGPWRPFESFLINHPDIHLPPEDPPETKLDPPHSQENVETLVKNRSQEGEQRQKTWSQMVIPSFQILTATHVARADHAHPITPRSYQGEIRQDRGAEWGTLIHGLLETSMRSPTPFSIDQLVIQARNLASDNLAQFTPEDYKTASSTVLGIMEESFWKTAKSSREYYSEVPFAIPLPIPGVKEFVQASPIPSTLTGVLDLVYRIEGGWEIVDYKTDLTMDRLEALTEYYLPQVRLYAQAWATITREPVLRVGLYFTREKKMIWRSM